MKKILLLAVTVIAVLLTSCVTGAALVGKSAGVTQEVWLDHGDDYTRWEKGTSYADLFHRKGSSMKVLAPLPSEMVTICFDDSGENVFAKNFEWKFPQLDGKEKWAKGYEDRLKNSPDIQKKFDELKEKYKDVTKYNYVVEVQFDASDIEFEKCEDTFCKTIWYWSYIPEGKVKNIKFYEWSLPNEVPVVLNEKEVAKRKIPEYEYSGDSFNFTSMKEAFDGFKFSGYTGKAIPILPLQVTRVGDHYSCEGYEFWCDSDNLVQGGKIQTTAKRDIYGYYKPAFSFKLDEKSGSYRLELVRAAL